MAEKKKRGEFTLSDEEYGSKEMVLITLSMLESRGYPGLTELMSVLDDPVIILKLVRFLYGTTIKIPSLQEFTKTLRAAIFAYCDLHKRINIHLYAKPQDIRQFMGITEEEQKELMDIFDQWSIYMKQQGKPIESLMHINRNNTLKRIKGNYAGKKWTSSKY